MKKYLAYLLLAVLLPACGQSLVDSFPNAAVEDKFIDEKLTSASHFDAKMLLKKHAAILSVAVTKNAPEGLMTKANDRLLQELQAINLIPAILPASHATKILASNTKMKQSVALYLEAISELGISNRDIARPLGKLLQTESYFVLQLDRWACADCNNNHTLRVKVRYIDAYSGEIIWSGIAKQKLSEQDLAEQEEILMLMIDQIAGNFAHKYITKWHKKRVQNL